MKPREISRLHQNVFVDGLESALLSPQPETQLKTVIIASHQGQTVFHRHANIPPVNPWLPAREHVPRPRTNPCGRQIDEAGAAHMAKTKRNISQTTLDTSQTDTGTFYVLDCSTAVPITFSPAFLCLAMFSLALGLPRPHRIAVRSLLPPAEPFRRKKVAPTKRKWRRL